MIHVFHRIFIENRLSCGVLFLNVFLSKWKLLFYTFLIIMKIIANHHYNTWLDWKKTMARIPYHIVNKTHVNIFTHIHLHIHTRYHPIIWLFRSLMFKNQQRRNFFIGFKNVVPFDRLIIPLRFRFMGN